MDYLSGAVMIEPELPSQQLHVYDACFCSPENSASGKLTDESRLDAPVSC